MYIREEENMASESETGRERIATIYELRLAFEDEAVKSEKATFTPDEVLRFFDSTARSI